MTFGSYGEAIKILVALKSRLLDRGRREGVSEAIHALKQELQREIAEFETYAEREGLTERE